QVSIAGKKRAVRSLLISVVFLKEGAIREHNEGARFMVHAMSDPHCGAATLEHVPKKLLDFFEFDMLQLFEFERFLIDQMNPFDRDAL
ncbi:MAG: hypothetical protein ACRECN_05470, partial [Methylocella sp.]